MDRQLDEKEMGCWRESEGLTVKEAADLISEWLECSFSKAEKIAGCRYPSELSASEQKTLAKKIRKPRDVLFPVVERAS